MKTAVIKNKSNKGFTLIEIMVVVVILGILGALIIPNIMGRTDDARATAAKNDLRSIASALELYRLDNYDYPSTDQGLEALVSEPSGFPEPVNWNSDGYLKKLPVDPWQVEYKYISPGAESDFDLYSLGADRKEGGEGAAEDVYHSTL